MRHCREGPADRAGAGVESVDGVGRLVVHESAGRPHSIVDGDTGILTNMCESRLAVRLDRLQASPGCVEVGPFGSILGVEFEVDYGGAPTSGPCTDEPTGGAIATVLNTARRAAKTPRDSAAGVRSA